MATDDDWQDWLDAHGPALVLFARQWASSHSDAEDVVQEAFLRFWKSRQAAHDPSAYLFACVRRCALEYQRARQRRLRRELHAARPEACGEQLFDAGLVHDERRALIEAALRELPEEQREVLVLRIWGGLGFQQIANVLGVSINTAASRYRYALAKLREQLAEEPTP